ncbi:MAG: aldehyde dehydrogenase family protein [Methanomicrobiaceae archaeon]|nr:aldehyde dehydrogenase family protein [Methanomicrobiaceae archaeon]
MEMLIGGAWNDSYTGEYLDVHNPATGERVGQVPLGCREDVCAAVDAAEEAFAGWSALTPRERGKILFAAAGEVRRQSRELGGLLTAEQGKPFREAVDEIRGYAHILEYYAGLSSSLRGDFMPLSQYGYALVAQRPLGVCAGIIPWNMPAMIMGWKVGPALVTGNTVVLKPASTSPLTCLSLAGILQDAGLPEGVLNVVTGPGEIVGGEVVRHPRVKKISFTGEIATGRQIMEAAAARFKRVTLELGGSDPMIVCDDADLASALDGAVRGRFYNCGQTCTAVKRLYVFESIAEEFIRQLRERVESLKVGNGMEKGVDMGPLNNVVQLERVRQFVEIVRKHQEGTIISGGRAPEGDGYDKGYFYLPTLVTDLSRDSVLLTEEVFGPILPIVAVEDLEDAIEQANSSRYGLGASIWSKNIGRVTQAAEQLEAGIVWVNQHLRIPPDVPFGGVKASGIGRENGYRSLEGYMDTRTVLIRP